jgi:hypothetical protein
MGAEASSPDDDDTNGRVSFDATQTSAVDATWFTERSKSIDLDETPPTMAPPTMGPPNMAPKAPPQPYEPEAEEEDDEDDYDFVTESDSEDESGADKVGGGGSEQVEGILEHLASLPSFGNCTPCLLHHVCVLV